MHASSEELNMFVNAMDADQSGDIDENELVGFFLMGYRLGNINKNIVVVFLLRGLSSFQFLHYFTLNYFALFYLFYNTYKRCNQKKEIY